MQKFEKVYAKIMSLKAPIIALAAFIVGGIRYIICRKLNCAIGWGMTAALIAVAAFIVFQIVGKRLLSSKTRGAEENIEKSKKEVEKVEK